MILRGRSSVRKVLSSGALALLLLCAPLQLAAQESVHDRDAHSVATASVLDWFAGFWSDLTASLTGGVVPDPTPNPTGSGGSNTDGGGCLDPLGGGCRG
jgi:hypothetical protein